MDELVKRGGDVLVFSSAGRVIALDLGERRNGSGRFAATAGNFYPFITEITPTPFRFESA